MLHGACEWHRGVGLPVSRGIREWRGREDAGQSLDAVQEAFIESGAFQCGFCTPGFVLMTRQLLDENPSPTDDDIRHYLSGNLCRCAAYPEIIKAVKLAAQKRQKRDR